MMILRAITIKKLNNQTITYRVHRNVSEGPSLFGAVVVLTASIEHLENMLVRIAS